MISQSATSPSDGDSPRSRRMGMLPLTNLPFSITEGTPSHSPPSTPPLPPRSPLRPRTRTISNGTRSIGAALQPIAESEGMTLLHSRSLGSLPRPMGSPTSRPKTPEKPLPLPPSPSETIDEEELLPKLPTRSKRTHALSELLETERAYASDMALLRDIYIPLALGQSVPLHTISQTPPSLASSSRTMSTASDDSATASKPPMTREDARIIFNNVADIAEFADQFTGRLEEALGSTLEGGKGEDHVGALFLEAIPAMEPIYHEYITKHPTALDHLNKLPQTPQLAAYLEDTRRHAQHFTNAWDLPSLLIKPVQRLLKYSLLLGAIIEETPDKHGDKQNLKEARAKMDHVAQGVNEGRRRREVVKELLAGMPGGKGEPKVKKKGLNLSIATSVSLGKVRGLKPGSFKVKEGVEANKEAESVARMGEELKKCEVFITNFARDTKHWARTVSIVMQKLINWTICFGKVLGITVEQKSEAFEAFLEVIRDGILPICEQLEQAIAEQIILELTKLKRSAAAPEKLLEAMRTLEPLHYGVLNFNVSKSRPPPQLQEASKSYVALRAQLAAELPRYLELLQQGIFAVIVTFVEWQGEFWSALREKWGELWDALKVDGEMQGEAAETLRVWWSRFAEVEAQVKGLNIVRVPEKKELIREKESRPKTRPRGSSFNDSIETGSTTSTIIISTFHAPEPHTVYTPRSSASSQTLVPSPTGGKYGTQLQRKPSNESFHSKRSGRSASSKHKHSNSGNYHSSEAPYESDNYRNESRTTSTPTSPKPSYSRTKSMPISMPMPLRKSSSQGRLLDTYDDDSSNSMRTPTQAHSYVHDDDDRGRTSRKPSIKRRVTDTLRPSSSQSKHRRSPSLPPMKPLASPPPQLSPSQSTFSGRNLVAKIPAMYACRVVHNCEPPDGVSYLDIPFFTLRNGDIFDVLQEAGHPSTHKDLPLYVDDGEDCLLLVRDRVGEIGWALASFLIPVD